MRREQFPDIETGDPSQNDPDSPVNGPSNGPVSPSAYPADDRIDRAIRTVWLAGHTRETQRLQVDLRSRMQERAFGWDRPSVVAEETAAGGILVHEHHLRHGQIRRYLHRNLFSLGAGLCVVGMLVFAAWLSGGYQITQAMAGHTSTYSTAAGERAAITLPDGSTVKLNVGSRLEVPSTFVVGPRTVRLEGEAFFSVVPNSAAPFTVISGTTTTKVLGTQFVVRRYPDDSATTVAVQDGKVSVESAIVVAAQRAIVYDGRVPKVEPVGQGHFPFVENVLTLDGQRLGDAIPELNRWYNADIRLGDPSLSTRRVGGQFGAGSINELRELLEMTLRVRVERSGRTLTLFSR